MDLDIEWLDDDHMRIGDTRFELYFADRAGGERDGGTFVVEKSRAMVELYRERFASASIGTMLEIGIRWGGSAALFHRLLRPGKLVAIDIVDECPPALAAYIRDSHAEGTLRPRSGVDQGDAAALRRVLAEETDGEPLDLVIDDGCHWLAESRVAFDALFPRLRPFGTYVIEDWGWAHWPGFWQENGGPWRHRPSLTQLLVELMMASASCPDVVASLEVRHDLAIVRRGDEPLDDDFALSRRCLTAGRRFVELGPHATALGRARARLAQRLRRLSARVRGGNHRPRRG